MTKAWVEMTDAAYEKVEGFRRQTPEPEGQAMWLEVTGTSGNRWTCGLSLKPLDAAAPRDVVIRHRDLAIVIRARDFRKVRGATIDWLDRPSGSSGLSVDNPNTPSPVLGGPPPSNLTGDVAERLTQVLARHVNPAIAVHGGRADLVAVERDTAYVRLSGGCQGCAVAAVTLRQGIETAIVGAVPEITRVVDVTDHPSGTNPYFQTVSEGGGAPAGRPAV
jgi:Fe/S biogenesis protein NfuA